MRLYKANYPKTIFSSGTDGPIVCSIRMPTTTTEIATQPGNRAGLQPGQFRRIAVAGFGDSQNAYPHAMAWFNDYLYVGTSRVILALSYHRKDAMKEWETYPIKPAPNHPYKDFDIRGQVWRYHPPTDHWEKVLTSPLVPATDEGEVAAFLGMRNMMPFKRPGAKTADLYLLTWSPQNGPGPGILRTVDGVTFESYKLRGVEEGVFSTFRPLVEFKGKMYSTPTGRTGSSTSAGVALVFETTDPVSEPWYQVNEDNFGDPENESVFEMGVFDNHLYAGTHSLQGLQLWKTDAEGPRPYRWKKILTAGAGRGPINQLVCSLCEFNGALYLGTAISNGGCDKLRGVGPAPAEILRIHPDDTWDLIMGDGRMTDQGFKMPLSGMASGFDTMSNGYLWRMCVHEGWLYAGTFSWACMLPFVPRDDWPDDKKMLMDPERSRQVVDHLGGFDLWRTRDGNVWFPVTRNGFANQYNYGVRTMASSPYGLFVGCANPFGPEVATERASGWHYEPNPRGGLEIWLGSPQEIRTPDYPSDVGIHIRASAPAEAEQPASRKPDDDETIDQVIAAFFEKSGFRCSGYWTEKNHSSRLACERLVFDLMSFAPAPHGHVLEIDCGRGGATAYLKSQYTMEKFETLAMDERDAEATSRLADRVHIHPVRMKGKLPAASYDLVINVESLSHRSDGLAWLGEASRVLKPGGALLMAAILSGHPAQPWKLRKGILSRAAATKEDFSEMLSKTGLQLETWVDCTKPCWVHFRERLDHYLWDKALDFELDDEWVDKVRQRMYGTCEPMVGYYLLKARKT